MAHPKILVKAGSDDHVKDIIPTNPKKYPSFVNVGGLNDHIQSLREMFIFPLLYPEVFSKYKINQVRGVLFYGPPGTGKTLVAGALANECSKLKKSKVTFFHRKAADILVKWVGESEQNLRELFSKADMLKPSIIFFDELDGLAPVRSCYQDHIHSSIVTTLLSLMDGLDRSNGILVIAATNRLDAIDPALRRSGRFDRELYFPLPNKTARKQILEVHTKYWGKNQTPSTEFLSYLADTTEGYSGSDLQALCAETVMCCIRRTYPNIDLASGKLIINKRNMKIEESDFLKARIKTVPLASCTIASIRRFSNVVTPLLNQQLNYILTMIDKRWPHFTKTESFQQDLLECNCLSGKLLIIGKPKQGHNTHMIPALLRALEHLSIHIIDVQAICENSTQTAEEICIQIFKQAQYNLPGIILIYKLDHLWKILQTNGKVVLLSLLEDLPAKMPLFVIVTTSEPLPLELDAFFNCLNSIVITMEDPTTEERFTFLDPLKEKAITVCKTELHILRSSDQHLDVKSINTYKRKRIDDLANTETKKLKVDSIKMKKIGSIDKVKEFNKRLTSSNMCEYTIHGNNFDCDAGCNVKTHYINEHFVMENSSAQLYDFIQKQSEANKKATLFDKEDKCDEENHACGDIWSIKDSIRTVEHLFKRAVLVTAKRMQFTQLELLYNVLSSNINHNKKNPEKMLSEMEDMLKSFENMLLS